MSWEMQSHMFGKIQSSIESWLFNQFGENLSERREWLLERLEDNGAIEVSGDCSEENLVDLLGFFCREIAVTTNGGHRFFADPEGRTLIPWVSKEDEY